MADENHAREETLEALHAELGEFGTALEKFQASTTADMKELREMITNGEKDDETKSKIDELSKKVADSFKEQQTLADSVDYIKRELDAPFSRGGKDLEDSDRQAAIELQKRAFIHKGGVEEDFKPDLNNLVKADDYRSAVRKLMKTGIEKREKIMRTLTDDERKAFDAASLDSGFFSPELLGMELFCDPECASLIDLYDSIRVSKTTYQYIQIDDYAGLGEYGCDATCDGPIAPEGSIRFRNGRVNDYRGVFCFQRNVLQEANYDLLGFMFRAINRSHRINRNQELITGKDGWLTQDCFDVRNTGAGVLTPTEFRMFLATVPWDFEPVTGVMHQNMFAYLLSTPKADGGFVFEDGSICVGPDSVSDCIRISNCLPDATEDLTKGTAENPFDAGAFIMAAANWESAYAAVEKRPLWVEQFEGGSTAWCVMYQFGAEDGGFTKCCNAGRVLRAGAPLIP